jgi:hypothetical protein
MPSIKPELDPAQLAFALFQFLEWADTEERSELGKALFDLANNACPQGTTGKVAFLAEATEWLTEGGKRQAEQMVDEAQSRGYESEAKHDKEDAREDGKSARHLLRLLTRYQKQAKATHETIRQSVPID